MKRLFLALFAALVLFSPSAVSAHDVPDFVKITVFLKPVSGRMLILVRMPANALIDFIFPNQGAGGWLDLTQAEGVGAEGARVWIANMLSIYEGDTALSTPQLVAVRIGRPNDPFFNSYVEAMNHLNGDHLPSETLLTQDQATVDALLQTPITSAYSKFSFEPRFERVGVVVDTSLTFLPANGGTRQFQYEGDPKTFDLDPSAGNAARRFVQEGFAHYLSQSDYWLFILCVALAFQRTRALISFALTLVCVEALALLVSLEGTPSAPWIPVLCGVLIAAATVYMGIEAIVAITGDQMSGRMGLAIGAGLIFGSGFWFELQPILQFSGIHPFVSGLAFDAGVMLSQLLGLALIFPAVQLLSKLSRAPRVAVIIAAALAIHVTWHRMLDRAYQLTLVPASTPGLSPATLALVIAAVIATIIAALVGSRYFLRRRAAFHFTSSAT